MRCVAMCRTSKCTYNCIYIASGMVPTLPRISKGLQLAGRGLTALGCCRRGPGGAGDLSESTRLKTTNMSVLQKFKCRTIEFQVGKKDPGFLPASSQAALLFLSSPCLKFSKWKLQFLGRCIWSIYATWTFWCSCQQDLQLCWMKTGTQR